MIAFCDKINCHYNIEDRCSKFIIQIGKNGDCENFINKETKKILDNKGEQEHGNNNKRNISIYNIK